MGGVVTDSTWNTIIISMFTIVSVIVKIKINCNMSTIIVIDLTRKQL